MNTTTFTTEQLRQIIPVIMEKKLGIVEPLGLYNSGCIEWMKNEPVKIDGAEERNGIVDIQFSQEYIDHDLDDGWTYRYRTLQNLEDIKKLL